MEFPSSIKKSFNKSTNVVTSPFKNKHNRKISAGGASNEDIWFQEEQPILAHQGVEMSNSGSNANENHEVRLKIDPSDRDYSYECSDNNDPPSKLIGQFLNKQRAAGGEMLFDVPFDDRENRIPAIPVKNDTPIPVHENDDKGHSRGPKTSLRDSKVSFQSPSRNDTDHEESLDEDVRKHNKNASAQSDTRGGGEVLRCSSVQRRQSVLRTKTRSRLMDDPGIEHQRRISGKFSGKSGQVKPSGMMNRASGMLGKPPASNAGDDEEDDPLLDDDIPEEFRNGNLNLLTILQWVSLFMIMAVLLSTIFIHDWKNKQLKGLQVWKWEMLVLVLICGRLVSGWVIRFVVFFIERNFLLRKRVLYFVYGVRKAVQNCIWLGLVLIAWHFLFDNKIEKQTNSHFLKFVNQLLFCFLAGSLLWLVKTLMVKVLASSFHVSTFFDRIQESLFNQYVIETLSGPPIIEINSIQEEEERAMVDIQKLQSMGINVPPHLRETAFMATTNSGMLNKTLSRTMSKKFSRVGSSRNGNSLNNKQEQGIPIDHLHKWNPKNISAWNMKRLMNIVRNGVLSTLDEQIHESNNGDESNTQIRSEIEAKAAARKIFQNVTRKGSKYIYAYDLMRFMREDEALKTMALLGGSVESEKISKYALKNWVVNAFRERKALALTLNDTKTAVNKLHQVVNILISIIIVVVSLVILGFATSKVLLFISSQIVVVAFVFGNTAKTVFEAIIFLFVMHPFDVGDRCEIDGVQMIVEEMNILNTVFLRFDNQKIYYPNSTLSTIKIGNYYRSPDMSDSVDFHIHIATPAEKLAMIRQRIISYIENKKDHWYPSPSVVMMNIEELHMVKLSVWMRHRMNHQNMGEKWLRRALVVEEMIKIFKENDIEYRLLPRDINVCSMPPITSTRTPASWVSPNNK